MMDTMKPDIERARAIIEAYGAKPEAWPEAERDMVLKLMAMTPSPLNEALAEAQWLDAALDCHVIAAEMSAETLTSNADATVLSLLPFAARRAQRRRMLMTVTLAVAASLCGIVFGLSLGMDEVSQMRRIAVLQETQFLIAEVDQ